MDPSTRIKDINVGSTNFNQTTASVIANLCNSESFNVIPPSHHDLISTNSIELNAAASLSDDSGVPLTTNSSISSGDSYRLGMCKFEIEMVESDGEVSQFDSLDNCSEGGMSAENFNTLKKGPIAPIDPPPEFQDSPQTTLIRSISKSIVNSLRRWTSSQSSFEHLKDNISSEMPSMSVANNNTNFIIDHNESESYMDDDKTLRDSYSLNKHMYSSDSILNIHTDNIYDEPNNIISTSLGNSVDIIESDSSSPLPPPPPPVSIVKIKQTLCPFYHDHTRYFKAIRSEQDNITSAAQRFNHPGLSDIHDYDLYYGAKRNTCQPHENSLQRKHLYSPLTHSHHCHNHHYHTGLSAGGNRPNSRNSLNSRLSSSHNSLSVSSANKPDDSIFITQAMSHDALLTREISDFYNVPIDSDIYAFPVDMIQSEKDAMGHESKGPNYTKELKLQQSDDISNAEYNTKNHQHKLTRKNNRNKRKKRNICIDEDESSTGRLRYHESSSKAKYKSPIVSNDADDNSNCIEEVLQEPLHMTLHEVKQFYHTLYSDSKSSSSQQRVHNGSKINTAKSSNETVWSVSSTRSRNILGTVKDSNGSNMKSTSKLTQKVSLENESINNNNNNVNTFNNHNNQQHLQNVTAPVSNHSNPIQLPPPNASSNNKQALQSEKKSQFTLSLKQKFCSIFRFRRAHRTSSTEVEENNANREQSNVSSDDKHKKFQTRALPPLPKKVENNLEEIEEKENKPEHRAFQFTSSIEKVKDYGWYWGPLSSEAAEKVLSNEPDGSFIVRDSSDDHYIFSLSFKLNQCVRHVRIEQDQGTFSFGSYAKFKSQTITEFIEKAVEHSRSGRYLFFLHRRPEHGPMRVQLTNPVSRFKHVQSLQHMCRFVILKTVIRKDLIQTLPLPRRLLDYLNYKHCYSEQVESDSSHSQISSNRST